MYRMSFRRRSGTEVKTPRAMTSRSILANHSSTWLSQEEYVGLKCRCTLGYWARNALTRVVMCAERSSAITWICLPWGWFTTRSVRNATNSAEVWPWRGLAQHLARLGVECRVQGECGMSEVPR